MSKHTKKEATAAEAVKYLSNLAIQFNDSAVNPASAAKLMEELAEFIQRHEGEKQQLQDDLESVKRWAKTVQLLLTRAVDMKASNTSGGRALSSAAKGNIDMALSILDRLKDPAFAGSCKKKPAPPSAP